MIFIEGKKTKELSKNPSVCFAQQYYFKKWTTQAFIRVEDMNNNADVLVLLSSIKVAFKKYGKVLNLAFAEYGLGVVNNGEEIIVYTK
jgi:hypothetical protein